MKLIALMKKEFHRFFHDPRLIFTLLLPGVLIFVLYSLLGNLMFEQFGGVEAYHFRVYLSGDSQAASVIELGVKESGSDITWLVPASADEAISEVERGEVTAFVSFSENFDEFPADAMVEIYYSADIEGEVFNAIASAILQNYGMKFTLVPHSFMTEENIGMTVMQSIMPMLVVAFIFSACMSVTLESVAGEKERGTLATILATSVKRPHIALGKILPLSCIAALGAASSFLGVILSLPKLMGISFSAFAAGYGVLSYLLLFLVILSIVPLIVSLIAVVSAFSKSVKEATAYTGIIMSVTIVLSIVSSFIGSLGVWVSLVPVLNVVTVMQEILSGGMPVIGVFFSIGMNLVYTALLVLLISKMLSSEKIMFGK